MNPQNEVFGAGIRYVRLHTQHAVFTICSIAVVCYAAWTLVLPNLMTKAEGAELYQSVGRIEIMVAEDRLEKKERRLRQSIQSGSDTMEAQDLRSELRKDIEVLQKQISQLEKKLNEGK